MSLLKVCDILWCSITIHVSIFLGVVIQRCTGSSPGVDQSSKAWNVFIWMNCHRDTDAITANAWHTDAFHKSKYAMPLAFFCKTATVDYAATRRRFQEGVLRATSEVEGQPAEANSRYWHPRPSALLKGVFYSNEVVLFRFLLVLTLCAGTRTSLLVQAHFAIFACRFVSEMLHAKWLSFTLPSLSFQRWKWLGNSEAAEECLRCGSQDRSLWQIFERCLRDIRFISHLVWVRLSLWVLNIWITSERAAFFIEKGSNQCLAREQSEKAVCDQQLSPRRLDRTGFTFSLSVHISIKLLCLGYHDILIDQEMFLNIWVGLRLFQCFRGWIRRLETNSSFTYV